MLVDLNIRVNHHSLSTLIIKTFKKNVWIVLEVGDVGLGASDLESLRSRDACTFYLNIELPQVTDS